MILFAPPYETEEEEEEKEILLKNKMKKFNTFSGDEFFYSLSLYPSPKEIFHYFFFSILNEFAIIVIGLHAVFHRKKIVCISPLDFPLKLTWFLEDGFRLSHLSNLRLEKS